MRWTGSAGWRGLPAQLRPRRARATVSEASASPSRDASSSTTRTSHLTALAATRGTCAGPLARIARGARSQRSKRDLPAKCMCKRMWRRVLTLIDQRQSEVTRGDQGDRCTPSRRKLVPIPLAGAKWSLTGVLKKARAMAWQLQRRIRTAQTLGLPNASRPLRLGSSAPRSSLECSGSRASSCDAAAQGTLRLVPTSRMLCRLRAGSCRRRTKIANPRRRTRRASCAGRRLCLWAARRRG